MELLTRKTIDRRKRTKISWASFFAVILTISTLALASEAESEQNNVLTTQTDAVSPLDVPKQEDQLAYDPVAEANKCYKQALITLNGIVAQHPVNTPSNLLDPQPTSILAYMFPNQQGPVATIFRILNKLKQQSWMPRFLSNNGKDKSAKKKEDMQGKAVKVIDLLEHAIELGHMEALYKLAHVSLFHLSPLLHNVTRAFEAYQSHAELTGNATSQAMLGFFYATGYNGVVEVDQAKSLLYYTFAAHGGDQGAQMTLGYRYWAGISVNDDCLHSLEWYQMAAEQSMAKFMSGPPGGRTLLYTPTKLSDLAGGAYGPGSSVASTGPNANRAVIRAASALQAGETWEDVLEYYMFNADRGELDFAFRLGKIFYQGSIYTIGGGAASGAEGISAIPRDYTRARYYFLRIARQIWPHDRPGVPSTMIKQEQREDGTLSFAAASAGYLGRMYLRGEGVKQDAAIAKMWFQRGAEFGEKESHNGLGIIWRDGLVGGKRDIKKAVGYFTKAANQELAEAMVNLGKHYYYENGDLKLATTFFENAIRLGSPFEPYYYLAEIHAASAQNPKSPPHHIQGSCSMAVNFYKAVAERGAWADDPVREGEARWKLGTERAREDAMLRWWIASERGIEIAQNNVAFILDQDKSILRLTRFAPLIPSNDTARLALTQWMRSAFQRNVDALVKVGDYYYHGLGVPDEPEQTRWERAAAFYQSAVDTQVSALAMWNLGWMYENGIGVPQDFHLAKRNYDLALQTNSEAYLPVMLSLIKLHIRSIWHTMMGGENGLSLWPVEGESSEDVATLDETKGENAEDYAPSRNDEEYVDTTDDSVWYKGKARDDHRRRLRAAEERQLEDDDPVQWARDRRNAENERESDLGPEDFFDDAIRGPGRRDRDRDREHHNGEFAGVDDDFAETMALVVLCLAVSVLWYIRGRWFERRRREEEERAAAQAGGVPLQGGQNVGLGVEMRAGEGVGAYHPHRGEPVREDWEILQ